MGAYAARVAKNRYKKTKLNKKTKLQTPTLAALRSDPSAPSLQCQRETPCSAQRVDIPSPFAYQAD